MLGIPTRTSTRVKQNRNKQKPQRTFQKTEPVRPVIRAPPKTTAAITPISVQQSQKIGPIRYKADGRLELLQQSPASAPAITERRNPYFLRLYPSRSAYIWAFPTYSKDRHAPLSVRLKTNPGRVIAAIGKIKKLDGRLTVTPLLASISIKDHLPKSII